MLVSLVIKLRAFNDGSLPPSTGTAMHGVFFRLLEKNNPGLAKRLHDSPGMKPFTVSAIYSGENSNPLAMARQTGPTALNFRRSNILWFRITSVDAELSEYLMNNFYGQALPHIDVLEHSFETIGTALFPREHPWAAATSWPDFLQEAAASLNKTNQTRLLFFSSTTFKSTGRSLPLPLPKLVFNGLLTRWNTFAPIPIEVDIDGQVEELVGISGYNLQTETVFLQGSRQGTKLVAFRGWCEYTVLKQYQELSDWLELLAQFAFFVGVGYKTTMGFGQTIALSSSPPPGPKR